MLTGMVLCSLIAVGLPYGEFVIKGTRLGLSSSTPAAFFLLFLLIAVAQPVLGLLRRSWVFTRGELLLITAMMMLTTAIPSRGFTGVTMPAIRELASYRAAVVGLVVGLSVMGLWLWSSGMPAWAVVFYLFGAFTIFLALTRVIVEAGLSSASDFRVS